MGRRKKKKRTVIFCYYCDRHFDNEKVLIEHQRGKHFKCPICHRRLSSARGMMIHVFQVHKESIDCVPHAKKGRDSFELEIFGMVGVPQELVQERLIKIYGEPAAKKQKIDHMPGVLLPGSGAATPAGMWGQQPPVPHGGRGMMGGMPGGRGYRPGGFVPGHGFMPPGPGRGGFGMHRGGPPGPLNPGPGNFMPPHHRPPHNPYHQGPPPQGRGFAPPPHQYAQPGMMPGMMAPHIQQQPISAAAKAEVVERADHLIQQSTISKKATKKKIIRVYDQPGCCMEEVRASASKYARYISPNAV